MHAAQQAREHFCGNAVSGRVPELSKKIVEVGRLMYERGWVAANDGNISVRLGPDRIMTTPTNVSKGMMAPEDQIVVDMDGNKVEGRLERTSEIGMHLAIYRVRPDVTAVVHAHPPVSTGFAAAGRSLNLALLPEVILSLGSIPLAPYALPGTDELARSLYPYIPKFDAIMMRNHGVVCYGADLERAFFNMETVEHFARITLVTELLGGGSPLPRFEVDRLFMARARYGVHSNTTSEPGSPLVAEDLERHRERFVVTRDELRELLDEAIRASGAFQ